MLNCMRYPNLEVHIMRSFLNTYAHTCLDQGHQEGYNLKPSTVQFLAVGNLRKFDGSHIADTKVRADIQKQHFQRLLSCHRHVQPLVHTWHNMTTQQSLHTWVQAQTHHILQDQPSNDMPTLSDSEAAVSALKDYQATGHVENPQR